MISQAGEEVPLLPRSQTPTPLRWSQLLLVLFIHFAEYFAAQVITPFTPQLIRDLGITEGNENRVGYYVGLLLSLSYLTQAFTILYWNRTSDRIGRKPVLLIGLFGLSISMYSFGLSKTFWGLAFSRCLNGALNGNTGVVKSTVAEMTDRTNIAQAYAYLPIAWTAGGTLGPIVGGSLSQPAERFPALFGHSEFLISYPYFLPCAISASYSAVALMVGFFFLKETVRSPAPISRLLRIQRAEPTIRPEDLPGSLESFSDTSTTQPSSSDEGNFPPSRYLLTLPVVIASGNYASVAFLDFSFRAIQPLFLSTPIHLGGLGLSPPTIGKILSMYGVTNGAFQMFFFARIHKRWGSKKVFVAGVLSAFPSFMAFPLINYLARIYGLNILVWVIVAFQTTISIAMTVSYGAVFMFITAAAPDRASLGATNGFSQMTVSFMRAIGPAAVNSLFSFSIENNYLGGNLVYCVFVAAAGVSTIGASFLPKKIPTD